MFVKKSEKKNLEKSINLPPAIITGHRTINISV